MKTTRAARAEAHVNPALPFPTRITGARQGQIDYVSNLWPKRPTPGPR